MDFYNYPYVDIIPFRNENEYNEAYGCGVTGVSCQGSQCKLTPDECEPAKAVEVVKGGINPED